VIAAVRHMAGQTIFRQPPDAPKEGPALVGMALKAEFVNRIRLDHLRPGAAMLVMALRAFHEAFLQRMVRLFVGLGTGSMHGTRSKAPVGHLQIVFCPE